MRYGDYAGTLDHTVTVQLLTLWPAFRIPVQVSESVEGIFEVRGGPAYGWYSLEETVSFAQLGGPSVETRLSATEWSAGGEASAGIRISLGRFILSARAGYRYVTFEDMDASVTINGTGYGSGPLSFAVDC